MPAAKDTVQLVALSAVLSISCSWYSKTAESLVEGLELGMGSQSFRSLVIYFRTTSRLQVTLDTDDMLRRETVAGRGESGSRGVL